MSDRLTELALSIEQMQEAHARADTTPQPCAGCAALREALVYIRAEIRDFGVQDADDAWYEAIEKVDAWLAQSQPDGTPTP